MSAKNNTPIKPDAQDFAALEREYGQLPSNASDAEYADRYRLAQANKLIRVFTPEGAR